MKRKDRYRQKDPVKKLTIYVAVLVVIALLVLYLTR